MAGKVIVAPSEGKGVAAFLAGSPQNDGLRDMDARLVIQACGLPIRIDVALVGGIGGSVSTSGAIDAACARDLTRSAPNNIGSVRHRVNPTNSND